MEYTMLCSNRIVTKWFDPFLALDIMGAQASPSVYKPTQSHPKSAHNTPQTFQLLVYAWVRILSRTKKRGSNHFVTTLFGNLTIFNKSCSPLYIICINIQQPRFVPKKRKMARFTASDTASKKTASHSGPSQLTQGKASRHNTHITYSVHSVSLTSKEEKFKSNYMKKCNQNN